LRRFIVTFLVDNGVDDVEKHFFVWLNRLRTNRAAQSADDFEHEITSLALFIPHQKFKFPPNKYKKAPMRRAFVVPTANSTEFTYFFSLSS
jgi:hypothetical protein